MRPLRMAGHLGFLPGRQPGIEVLERLPRLDLDAVDLLADCSAFVVGLQRAQFLDLASSSATGFSKSR